VTLYGKVDLGYKNTTTKDAAGVVTDKFSGMSSGNQSGSRWGLKGTEDLGGGLKASFNYEASVTANTGAGNDNFARRSVLELSGGFGKIGMGRDYNPTFSLIGATDPTGVDGSSIQDYLAGVRDSNMFLYTTPALGGFTGKLGVVTQRTGEPADKSSVTDMSGTYSAGALMAGLAHRVTKPTTAGVAGAKTTQTTVGATYDMGMAKAYFNYVTVKVNGSGVTDKETNLGVSVPMGAVTLLGAVGRDSATGQKSASDYTFGADYSLSKMTNVYARVMKNGAIGGGKTTGMFAGVRHSF
jgi:predicted porin